MRGESLAFRLRGGNAGLNTAADHIAVLDEALAQIPSRRRRDVLVTVDGAGATLDLVPAHRHAGRRSGALRGGGCTTRWGSTLMSGPAPPSVTYRNRCGKRRPTPIGTPATQPTPGWPS